LRVVFAGTPAFASAALQAIAGAGHDVALVLTQPDRPAGRGMRLTPSEVANAAVQLGIPVEKPATLREASIQARLRELRPDACVVAAYGLILPRAVLDIPTHGCLNIHASLLPRWRGAAPIQRALLAGDTQTGVCIMRMAEGLDTGPVLLARPIPIEPRDTTGTLTSKLARLGADAVLEALARLPELRAQEQDASLASYAAKVEKSEALVDWTRSATEIDRQVRAYNPAPGAEANLQGNRIKIWEAEPVAVSTLAPGAISTSESELMVGCGEGALRLLQVQKPGGRKLAIGEFLRGHPFDAVVQ